MSRGQHRRVDAATRGCEKIQGELLSLTSREELVKISCRVVRAYPESLERSGPAPPRLLSEHEPCRFDDAPRVLLNRDWKSQRHSRSIYF